DELIMSDGTASLTRRDPDTFAPVDTIEVTLDDEPITQLNELECVDDTVWANVWRQDVVVGIDPDTGAVHSVVDASTLLDPSARTNEAVLNGIAHDEEADTFWLTGKYWPTLFEVRFVPADS
ncbi:MAG: glutaminyl-peptide cyclotransferase, partial [Acidimicrobiia bacterium]|nr:glutaminyl-peptide cyclotransferase [Acidimicrobiia bacterium]